MESETSPDVRKQRSGVMNSFIRLRGATSRYNIKEINP
jgi:hypothetical protein